MITTVFHPLFTPYEKEILRGLTQKPKRLNSKYFYDDEGSHLFQQIMHLPEYYLTRCEYEILDTYKSQLLALFSPKGEAFDLIELGAGDGLKTKILLTDFAHQKAPFTYQPIDISAKSLEILTTNMLQEIPNIKLEAMEGDYFTTLHQLKQKSKHKKVVLFLGSNVGNFTEEQTIDFLIQLKNNLQKGDMLLLGFDLKKHPRIILDAYNDSAGITKAFNINLLARLNRELSADFDLTQFEHYPLYDPDKAEARSYLVSNIKQTVYLATLDTFIYFEAGETIHTEISRKYSIEDIQIIAQKAGFTTVKTFTDAQKYFADMVLES
jgi:L-histidine Nalpha-methyltransferase